MDETQETPHQKYVREGGCPYVGTGDQDKVWCNDKVHGHRPGPHWATRLNHDMTTTIVYLHQPRKQDA